MIAMKNILIAVAFLFNNVANAQLMYQSKPVTTFVEMYDESGKPLTANQRGVKGSPLWKNQWSKGTVHLKSGKELKDVPLILNLVTGELHFKVDDMEFAIGEPVETFNLEFMENEITKTAYFKSLPTDSKANHGYTNFEVVADGNKYQLLKHIQKQVKDYFNYGSAAGKEFSEESDWYIYHTTDKQLIATKGKKIEEIFPENIDLINQLIPSKSKQKKLGQSELMLVIAALNK